MQVIQNQKPATQMVQAKVNDKQLLTTMKHLFKSNFSVLGELMQNARRAGASEVSFDFDPKAKTLIVTDDGIGIADFGKLIDLCTSGWGDDVVLKDNPFGMGFFSVFFACDVVTIRSNGLRLTATHADIIEKRVLGVTLEDEPVAVGTVLELTGLKKELLSVNCGYQNHNAGNRTNPLDYTLGQMLASNAKGFPIDVKLNGVSLPRSHAQQNLSGVQTPSGFVHVAHVHDDRMAHQISVSMHSASLYLQGLPVNASYCSSGMVVHLDGQVFTAQMPDRTGLFEAESQLHVLSESAKQIVRDFLSERKKTLDPSEFVKTYWDACLDFDTKHLLNDIPVVKRSAFSKLVEMTFARDDRWKALSGQVTDDLVSKADIESGAFRAWRDVPDTIEDSEYWAVLQKLVIDKSIYAFNQCRLHQGHWLYKAVPSCNDFVVEVTPIVASEGTPKGAVGYSLDEYECTIKVVNAVDVKVTSKIDSDFLIQKRFDDCYVIVGENDDQDTYEKNVTCYAMAGGNSGDCPVLMFSTFRDVHEDHDEKYQDEQIAYWDSLVNNLLGLPLAANLAVAINEYMVATDDAQLGQMALVHASRPWREHTKDYGCQRLCVADLEDKAVWERLADFVVGNPQLGAAGLKSAFIHAIGGTGLTGKV